MEPHIEPESQAVNEWIRFGLRLGVSAALHPFEYSKVLIQLGYEPIAPRPGRSLLGKPILALPNIFQYAGYIKSIDGFFGCYRGLTPKLVGSVVGAVCSERIVNKLGMPGNPDDGKDESEMSEEEQFQRFQDNLKRDIVVHVTGIIVTHPFNVISLRMMAQFIGRESTYTSILGSIVEIYKHEGIFGFFSGVIPKLLCDLACVTLTSTTVFLVNKYLIRDRDTRQYCASFTQFVFSSLLYPLQVVSSCMAISGSGLSAGQPPIMPIYKNWSDCWSDLQARGELKRGSSLFWRSARSSAAYNKFSYAPLPAISKYS